jgi:hypothetical protein
VSGLERHGDACDPAASASDRQRLNRLSNARSSIASFFSGWRSTPGTMPSFASGLERQCSAMVSLISYRASVRLPSGGGTRAASSAKNLLVLDPPPAEAASS